MGEIRRGDVEGAEGWMKVFGEVISKRSIGPKKTNLFF